MLHSVPKCVCCILLLPLNYRDRCCKMYLQVIVVTLQMTTLLKKDILFLKHKPLLMIKPVVFKCFGHMTHMYQLYLCEYLRWCHSKKNVCGQLSIFLFQYSKP